MAKNLVIVESPAKAKTISKILGQDFQVESSYGHIRDLVSKDMGVDVNKGFLPNYEVTKDKKEVVKKLKKLSQEAEVVWLASDEDREGEAIAWHLAEALKLDPRTTNRIVFHEITASAIKRAVDNPRRIDVNLVNAQQARRVLDRLVGFELSPVLWKKVRAGLSAGRVQSVSVRLIAEREREIQQFTTKGAFRIQATFVTAEGKSLQAEVDHRFEQIEDARNFLQACVDFNHTVKDLEVKPGKRSPAPPFTTSTLQQEASRKLGFSVSQTMTVAQKLYESGLITYMRTDSVNLSNDALAAAKATISENYGEHYSKVRNFSTKSKGAQEAHEAIRPTNLNKNSAGADAGQKRLYELIWKRTMASQMADAELERTTVKIGGPDAKHPFVAKGEVIKFDGFLKLYLEGTDEDDSEEQDGMLPRVSVGDGLKRSALTATERFTKHPPRYTEASLVKKLEELGIGRPSTYAPTISTIQKRNYVMKSDLEGEERTYSVLQLNGSAVVEEKRKERTGADKGKLMPTDIGLVVNDFLVEHFERIMDYHFTANVEEEFDHIAAGELDWQDMIGQFYKHFHPNVEEVIETAGFVSGERQLGTDPKTGKPVSARVGRYGPVVQLGEADPDNKVKPQFAGLQKGQSIDTITLEEALKLFDLPRELGTYEGKAVGVGIGRFGPYVKHGSSFISIKKTDGDDPYTIELKRAIELIEAKKLADANRVIAIFDQEKPVIEVLNGRFGPYIKSGKDNYKIPKGIEPAQLDRDQCLEIMSKAKKK